MTLSDQPAPGRYRRQLLRNTAAVGLANGWTAVLTLATLPLMLRGLGTAAFGLWALLQTFSGVTGWFSLADLGLGISATRSVATSASTADRQGAARIAGTAIATATAIGFACALGLVVIGRPVMPDLFKVPDGLHDDLRLALLPFALQVLFEIVGSVAGYCLDGLQRIDLARTVDSLRRTLVLGSSAGVALVTEDLVAVVTVAAAATLATTVAALVVVARELGTRPRFDRTTQRDLLHYGRRVWLLGGTGVLHRMMDRTVVGVILGPAAVALVEIATQVQAGVASVLSASSYAATSSAAWVQARDDQERLRELALRGTRYTCLATIPLCGLVAVLASPLLEVWLPADYGEAAGLVALALVYVATQAPLATGSNLLVGIGRAGDVLGPAVVAVAVNLIASIVLVNAYGIAGAFVATIISSLVLNPLLAAAVARATGVSVALAARTAVLPTLVPALAAVAAAGALVLLDGAALATLAAGFVVGLAAWMAVAWAVTLSDAEKTEVRAMLPSRR